MARLPAGMWLLRLVIRSIVMRRFSPIRVDWRNIQDVHQRDSRHRFRSARFSYLSCTSCQRIPRTTRNVMTCQSQFTVRSVILM